MKFSCDQCHAQYMIADEKVGTKGVKVKCKKCSHIIVVKPSAETTPEASTETAPAAEGGAGAQMGGAFDSLFGGAPAGAAAAGAAATAAASESPAGGFDSGTGSFDSGPGSFDSGAGSFDSGAGGFGSGAGSFDSGVGGGDDLGLGALAQQASTATPAPSRPAGEKEWYVAIDDSQVGPIDIAEIEQRWDARELDEDSLAWKAGMSDWVPVAEIPELAYLVTERPHAKPQVAAQAQGLGAGMGMAGGAAAGFGGVGLGPVSLGGAAGDSDEGISWKPSAASALSSLVQEELVAASAPKPEAQEPQKPAGVPDLGMPSFGTGELFGGGGNGSAAPRTPDPFSAAPAPSWSVPTTPRREGGSKGLYALVGFLAVAVLGVLGFLIWQQMRPVGMPPAAAVPGSPTADKPAEAKAADAKVAAKETEAPKEAAADSKPAAPAKKPEESHRAVSHSSSSPPKHESSSSHTASKETKKKDDLDELLNSSSKKPKAAAKPRLSKDDIFGGVRSNMRSVQGCIANARGKGELVPGKYTFILDWTIQPDGSVRNARLKGPSNVMGTSLPGCFAQKMRGWSFPAAQNATPIANFPFGPITIH